MKHLYNRSNDYFLCSVSSLKSHITEENREKCLKSLVFRVKENKETNELKKEGEIDKKENSTEICKKIVETFNEKTSPELKTSLFEVIGIYNSTIPNICTINSICASFSVIMGLEHKNFDFIYYRAFPSIQFQTIKISKDSNCFLCQKSVSDI